MKRAFQTILLLFLFIAWICGQQNPFRITRYSTQDGLTQSSINSVIEDRYGFIWLGTSGGINRFDGYNFTSFELSPGEPSASDENMVHEIISDPDSNIWVCSIRGIHIFNYRLDRFESLQDESGMVFSYPCNSIAFDHLGNLWAVFPRKGLMKFNLESRKWKMYTAEDGIPLERLTSIKSDNSGTIWMGSMNGLIHFIPRFFDETEKFHLYQNDPDNSNSLSNNVIHSIFQDSKGDLWFGTNLGIGFLREKYILSEELLFESITEKSKPHGLSHNDVRSVCEDKSGNIWVATRGGGLNIISYSGGEQYIKTIFADSRLSNTISHNEVLCLFCDSWGQVWAGTHGGLSKISLEDRTVSILQHNRLNSNSLSGNSVPALIENPDGTLWIGTTVGLNRIELSDFDAGQLTYYRYMNPDFPGDFVRANKIQSLQMGNNDDLWVGSKSGISRFDIISGTYQNDIRVSQELLNKYGETLVRKIELDSRGNIWIGTDRGLLIYHKTFDQLLNVSEILMQDQPDEFVNIKCILIENDSTIWAGSMNSGLIMINYSEDGPGFSIGSLYNTSNTSGMTSNYITDIYLDTEHNLWLGTSNGLYLFDDSRNSLKKYTGSGGLSGDYISGIIQDNSGQVWVSSLKGISKYNPTGDIFESYYTSQTDLSLYDYTFDLLCTSDNLLLFGGVNGLTSFRPEDVSVLDDKPEIYFTGLKINNNKVLPGSDNNGLTVLDKHINFTENIILKPGHKSIELEYVSLHANHPDRISYFYMLEGQDEKWIQAGTDRRFAGYSNLQPGKYVIRVKSSNSYGVQFDNERLIRITVLAPAWRRAWAMAIYVVVFIGLLFLFRLNVINREKLKSSLVLERINIEKQEELNQAKLRFFTNISHDFKTPLTLIKSPIEKLISEGTEIKEDEKSKIYRVIHRNSSKLINMVSQLLEFRKAEQDVLKLSVSEIDIVKLLKESAEDFYEYACEKALNFNFSTDLESLLLWFDGPKIDRAVNNVLHNAFKYTPSGGSIFLELKVDPNEENAIIRIEDTGIGIPEEQLEKVFDRFYQVERTGDHGTGIGLPLAKKLVELHGGQIQAESQVNSGSVFIIQLPLGKEHLPAEAFTERDVDRVSMHQSQVILESDIQINKDKVYAATKQYSILIAEDNPDLMGFLSDNLSREYNVISVENGKKALKESLLRSFDLVITDIIMPEMDGIQLCNNLKSNIVTSHIPVIMLTAKTSDEARQEGYETGADAYIGKPFTLELLYARIKNIIESRENLKRVFQDSSELDPSKLKTTSRDEKFLSKIIQLVEDNLSDCEFKIESLVREVGMSRSMLYRKLQELTGQSPHEFTSSIRFKNAARLLLSGEHSISEVAYMVGFNDPRYFSRSFRQTFNQTPSEYIKNPIS